MEDDKDEKLKKIFLSLDMKTKVAWHVPRIRIKGIQSLKIRLILNENLGKNIKIVL